MPTNRREFNKQETMRHIREIFLSLYAQGGIESITVSGLCAACGIAKSTFYLYFEDKYAVLDAIERNLLDGVWAINGVLADCDLEDVRRGRALPKASESVRFIKGHSAAYKALLGPYGDPQFIHKWKRGIERSIQGCFDPEKDDMRSAQLSSTIFSSAMVGVYTHFIFEQPDLTEREMAIILGNLFKYVLLDCGAFL